jgi:hypothetical protein
MSYNLVEAGNAVGRTKNTILKAIKRGAISASRDERGGWCIDPAELHRVYPPVSQFTQEDPERVPVNRLLEEVRARLADAQEQIADLRHRLTENDHRLSDAHARIAVLLTDQRPRRSWWTRMARR